MQSETTYIAALEIGSSKVRAAVGQINPDAPLTVTAVEEEALPSDIVRYGVVRNVEKVANAINRLISRLNRRLSPRSIKSVYVALGGRSVSSSERCVERQLPEDKEITPGLIRELRLEAMSTAPLGILGADDMIGALPRYFVVDGITTTQPEGEVGRDISACFVIVAAQDKLRKNIERVVSEKLGLEISGFILRPIAVADYVLSNDERALGCMLVDFGAETTTVSVYKNSRLQYLSTLPIGSRNITRDIMALPYLEEQAESLKRTGGNAMPKPGETYISSGVDFSQINNFVAARASEIIINIRAQIQAAGFTAQELPKGIVIVGGGAKLRGFNERLAELTKMRVRAGLPSASVRIADGTISPGEFIDIISVLADAAHNPEECLTPLPEPEPEPEPEIDDSWVEEHVEPEPEKKMKRPGFFRKWGDKLVGLMKDDDLDNDENDFRDDE